MASDAGESGGGGAAGAEGGAPAHDPELLLAETPERVAMLAEFRTWAATQPQSPHLPLDDRTALLFMRGTKWLMPKAQEKWHKLVALHNELGACDMEQVSPMLMSGAQVYHPGAIDKQGHPLLYIVPEHINAELDNAPLVRVSAAMFLYKRIMFDFPDGDAAHGMLSPQAYGIVGVLDFQNAPFTFNRTAQADGTRLNEAFPARLRKFLIVDPPWFFSVIYRMAALVMPQKMLDRVEVVSREELQRRVEPQHLLKRLGGELPDHMEAFTQRELERERAAKQRGEAAAAAAAAQPAAPPGGSARRKRRNRNQSRGGGGGSGGGGDGTGTDSSGNSSGGSSASARSTGRSRRSGAGGGDGDGSTEDER